jgi:hypothetical protein
MDRKFDLEELKKPRSILIAGKRVNGKTTLAKDILYHWKITNDNCYIFDETYDISPQYKNMVDELYIGNYDSQIINKIISFKYNNIVEYCDSNPYYIVFDDVLYNKKIDNIFNKFITTHRHYNISPIITTQYVMELSRNALLNIDYVFIPKKDFNHRRHITEVLTVLNLNPYLIDNIQADNYNDDYLYVVLRTDDKNFYQYYQAERHNYTYWDEMKAATTIQKHWRRVLAQRQLQRMKIKREVEFLPDIGIEYKKIAKRFKKNYQ